MQRVVREVADRLPGTSELKRHLVTEWVCPECEYFEEAEAEDTR